MRAMRKLLGAGLGAVLLGALLVLASPTSAVAADSGTEAQFVSKINGIRQSVGLAPLAVSGQLQSVARSWSDQMAANGGISHNGNLAGQVSGGWSKLGENVGVGGDVSSLMNAFVASSGHYKNIVDPAYNYIGVGVTYDGSGTMYVTHDFMALGDVEPPTPEPEPEPASAPAPAPASAPTSSAPAPKQKAAAAAPASDLAPVADAATAEEPPPPPPPPPATSTRVHTVLTALRAVGT
jgi:hypothetical protein